MQLLPPHHMAYPKSNMLRPDAMGITIATVIKLLL